MGTCCANAREHVSEFDPEEFPAGAGSIGILDYLESVRGAILSCAIDPQLSHLISSALFAIQMELEHLRKHSCDCHSVKT